MRAFDEFLKYKTRIPVRGAILMNDEMDAAVLVKGWKKGANWSFPRGKINWAEDDLTCAIREVYEETGYDIEAAGLVPDDRQVKHIDITMHDQQMRLYVFRNVPMNTNFEPRTRKEISKIQWWRLSDLPAYRKKDQQQQNDPTLNPNKFYMVAPFLPHLRKWVVEQKRQDTRRVTSNQYLSAGISHDEGLTEEDQGMESNTQGPSYPAPARQHIDTLEGTNEALRALLKIQPSNPGMQSGAMKAPSPVAENKGNALLALLQGKPSALVQQYTASVPPQTPLEHPISQAPQPTTPNHQHPKPPNFATLPPPPAFPIQQSHSYSYEEPDVQNMRSHGSMPAFPHHQTQNLQHSRAIGNPHAYQNQNLVHPQPLPPHVQRAVFTGGPVHAPMVPQSIQESFATQMNPAISSGPINTQFPGLHAPMVPEVQTQPPSKLTSHALALLNAFKTKDQANGVVADSNLPLRRYTEEPAQLPPLRPQELPAEVLRLVAADPLSQYGLKQTVPETRNPNVLAPKPTSEEHRSALLDLFKSPTAQAAIPIQTNAATALPMTNTPSAVELSAVDTLSSNAAQASPAASQQKQKAMKKATKEANIPEMNPESNLPFRAMKILARPTQASDSESPRGHISAPKQHPQSNGKRPVSRSQAQPSSSPEKPFQPQILKRPQSGTSKAKAPSGIPSPTPFPTMPILPASTQHQAKAAATDHKQTLQSLLAKSSSFTTTIASPSLPQPSNHTAPPTDHKAKLLSLFNAASPSVQPMQPHPPAPPPPATIAEEDVLPPLFSIDPTQNATTKSRLGSLASGETAASRRSSQTPMSPADKGFLLGYLDSVTKGGKR